MDKKSFASKLKYMNIKSLESKFNTVVFIIVLFNFFSGNIKAQKPIEVWKWKDMEQHLDKQNDTVYVVNFWATWCRPCVKELPHFMKLNEKYKNKKFKMILASLDAKNMIKSKLEPFVHINQIGIETILLDEPNYNRWISKVDKSWEGSIPATAVWQGENWIFIEDSFELYSDLQNIIDKFEIH